MTGDTPRSDPHIVADEDVKVRKITTRHARCVLMMRGTDIIRARKHPVWLNGGLVLVID